ncbi:MAG: exosortase/archaeosortase family protein [Verrucomicrobia bacterium]|nr:exosortase/archaeosortase family protein [Verrucomicrobiota bacterium]
MTEKKKANPTLLEEFRADFPRFWRGIPDKGLFFGLLAVWSALFQFWGNAVFGWVDTPSMFHWAYFVHDTAAEDGHGKLIPLVVLGLLWWKHDELLAAPKRLWWPALGLVLGALVLHVLGFMVQQTRISIIAYCVGVYGLTGLVWGRHWLHATFFPMFLLAFCVPFGTLSDPITLPLRLLVAKASVGFAHIVLGISVMSDGTYIFSEGYQYDVAAACSGLRSLTALLIITIIYGFLTFKTNLKRCLIIGSAVPIAIVGNIVRLTLVIVTADAFGNEAGVFVETKLGFVTFAIAIACMLGIGYLLRDEVETKRGAARRVSMEAKPA